MNPFISFALVDDTYPCTVAPLTHTCFLHRFCCLFAAMCRSWVSVAQRRFVAARGTSCHTIAHWDIGVNVRSHRSLISLFDAGKPITARCLCGCPSLQTAFPIPGRQPFRVDDFSSVCASAGMGCRYLLTDIQHQLQTAEMHSVPVFGTLVEKPEEEGYKHEAHNDQ